MKVTIKHFDGKYPSFNVLLASAAGKEPFLEIKGCRIVEGKNGEFVSWPASKKDDGKYWNHAYASEEFNAHVLQLAKADMPKKAKAAPEPQDDLSDCPF